MGLVRQDRGSRPRDGARMPRDGAAARADIGFARRTFASTARRRWPGTSASSGRSTRAGREKYAEALLRRFDLRAEQKIKGMSHDSG